MQGKTSIHWRFREGGILKSKCPNGKTGEKSKTNFFCLTLSLNLANSLIELCNAKRKIGFSATVFGCAAGREHRTL